MTTRHQSENEPMQPKNRSGLSDGIRNYVYFDVKWPTINQNSKGVKYSLLVLGGGGVNLFMFLFGIFSA